jgi:hypothetical protein
MLKVNSMNENERRSYIFENQDTNPDRIVDNRFAWLEGALLGDIQTFVNSANWLSERDKHLILQL